MKAKDVEIGGIYWTRFAGKAIRVQVMSEGHRVKRSRIVGEAPTPGQTRFVVKRLDDPEASLIRNCLARDLSSRDPKEGS